MKIKLDTERFVFPNGEWQDLPNTTLDESVAVVSKEVDLSTVKYEGGKMIPLTEEELLYKLMEERAIEGNEIVNYLTIYLNTKAKEYGYDNYHSSMIYINSSDTDVSSLSQAFFNCVDAVWSYVKSNRDSFEATGHPNLEEIKLNHPKLEDYLV